MGWIRTDALESEIYASRAMDWVKAGAGLVDVSDLLMVIENWGL